MLSSEIPTALFRFLHADASSPNREGKRVPCLGGEGGRTESAGSKLTSRRAQGMEFIPIGFRTLLTHLSPGENTQNAISSLHMFGGSQRVHRPTALSQGVDFCCCSIWEGEPALRRDSGKTRKCFWLLEEAVRHLGLGQCLTLWPGGSRAPRP
jgi:hypothetical protein